MHRLLLILFLSLLVAAPAASAAPAPRTPAGWLGAMVDGPMLAASGAPSGEWTRMRRAGVESVRAAFYWQDLEPQPGVYDFSTTDRIVAAAVSRRMRVLPVIIRAPAWARDGDHKYPPRDPELFRGVMDQLVHRYGPEGSFWAERPDVRRAPLRDWQIWNEPSLPIYWWNQPFEDKFVPFMRVAYDAVHTADPGARVVLAGLTNYSWKDLERFYANGGGGTFDVVALHPYTRRPSDVIRAIERNRAVMRRHGDGALPVWATELTWAAIDRDRVYAEPTWSTTAKGQAYNLRLALRKLARARKRLKIERVFWYTWLSRYRADDWTDYAGLRKMRGGRPRSTPALKSFTRMARELQR